MAGGLDNLSADSLSKLASKLNEATKNLEKVLKQQEKLLKDTLEVEQKIISTRVAGLKEYNDGYSKLLNSIKSETSTLSAEMFNAVDAGNRAAAYVKNTTNKSKNTSGTTKPRKRVNATPSSTYNRQAGDTVDDELVNKLGDADSANWEAVANKKKSAIIAEDELKAAMAKREEERIEVLREREQEAYATTLKAAMAKEQALSKSSEAKKARLSALKEVEISNIAAVAQAEQNFYELKNGMMAKLAYAQGVNYKNGGTDASAATEVAEAQLRKLRAIEDAKALHEIEKQMDAERAKAIYQAQLKNNGELHAADLEAINKMIAEKYDSEEKLQAHIEKLQKKQLEEKRREEERSGRAISQYGNITALDPNSFDKYSAHERLMDLRSNRDELVEQYKSNGADEDAAKMSANFKVLADTLSSLAQELESKIESIAGMKGAIDTRLQGSNNKQDYTGSYWNRITKDIISVGAISPYFKQEAFANKIKELVDSGIAFDLEQRAFLATISDKIATTFNVADSTLLRLIRIQQQDSTAGRLGMESALNTFLNSMYENTEYLKNVAAGVRNSLEEMQALMEGAAATEVEYQVQKWMGSLYSVGMSQNAVNSITTALGQIAAGQIEGLTGGGAGNLLVMAANNAGVPIADILAKGLTANETNELLQATVNYLAELAESSKDNQVVQQQLANVFGVKASDLRAATNLATNDTIGTISNEALTYDNMLSQLYKMANTMISRTSIGEMMSNVWDNVQYSLAGSMASSPISYLIYKMAGLLESTTGGIDIGLPMILGNGLPVQFKVSDLMRAGSMATSVLGTLPQMINGLVTSTNGSLMLASMGIDMGSGLAVTPRGDGSGVSLLSSLGGGGTSVSGSGYVGNASVSDIKESTIQQNEDEANRQVVEALEEAEETQIDTINATVLKIYELLDDVAHGNSSLSVRVEGYGLTKSSSSNSLGGVSALDGLSSSSSSLSNSNNYSTSGGGFASSGVNSGGINKNIDFGGWTTVL